MHRILKGSVAAAIIAAAGVATTGAAFANGSGEPVCTGLQNSTVSQVFLDSSKHVQVIYSDHEACYIDLSSLMVPGPTGATGPAGPVGPTGATGATGLPGAQGAQGPKGDQGAQGIQGIPGVNGANGTDGTNGTKFSVSDNGLSPENPSEGDLWLSGVSVANNPAYDIYEFEGGAWIDTGVNLKGATGDTGATGAAGQDGTNGTNGTNGQPGAAGKDGQDGAAGPQGPQGPQGFVGATGAAGSNGAQGATGTAGKNGSNGAQGIQGRTGATGATGAKGATGQTGAAGKPGASTSSVTPPPSNAYYEVAADGGVFAFNGAHFYGSLPQLGVKVSDIVNIVIAKNDTGYWLIGADGRSYGFGHVLGSPNPDAGKLNQPMVAGAAA